MTFHHDTLAWIIQEYQCLRMKVTYNQQFNPALVKGVSPEYSGFFQG